MTRHFLALSFALLLGVVPVTPVAAAGDDLYVAFGEKAGLAALMDDFVERLVVDSRTKPFFERADLANLKTQLTAQLCALSGGPCQDNDGQDMKTAHEGLGIRTESLQRARGSAAAIDGREEYSVHRTEPDARAAGAHAPGRHHEVKTNANCYCGFDWSALGSADDPEIGPPRTDFVGILPREHARDLRDVIEVVCDPRGQQLSHRDDAQFGMAPAPIEVGIGQAQRRERAKTVIAQHRELVEQAGQRPPFRRGELCEAIERIEWARLAMLEDDPGARDPVSVFAMNQMSNDVERTPGLPAFMRHDPAGGSPRRSASSVAGVRVRMATASSIDNRRRVRSVSVAMRIPPPGSVIDLGSSNRQSCPRSRCAI